MGWYLPTLPANITCCRSAPSLLLIARPKGPCSQHWWCNNEKAYPWSQDAQSRAALSSRNTMQATCVVLSSLVTTLKKVKWNSVINSNNIFYSSQWFSTRGDFAPGGIWQCLTRLLGNVIRQFLVVITGSVLVVFNGWKPEMQLNILQCTGDSFPQQKTM